MANSCNHGVTFDPDEARRILESCDPSDPEDFIMGNPASAEIRQRWPRLQGVCPLGCGFQGIAYASSEHYAAGDW
jgi:hypothetical protein